MYFGQNLHRYIIKENTYLLESNPWKFRTPHELQKKWNSAVIFMTFKLISCQTYETGMHWDWASSCPWMLFVYNFEYYKYIHVLSWSAVIKHCLKWSLLFAWYRSQHQQLMMMMMTLVYLKKRKRILGPMYQKRKALSSSDLCITMQLSFFPEFIALVCLFFCIKITKHDLFTIICLLTPSEKDYFSVSKRKGGGIHHIL